MISFLYCAHFACNIPLVSLIFLKRSPVFPILLLSSISLHWSLRKAFLSLLVFLWNFAFKWVYLSICPLLVTFLLPAICKASSEKPFCLFYFFFLGMIFVIVSCTMLQASICSSSGTLLDLILWFYLSLPLYNHKEFDLGHTWMWFSLLFSV